MSEENANPPVTNQPQQQSQTAPPVDQSSKPAWYDNPPAWYNQAPTTQPQSRGGEQRGYGADIVTRLDALPERLADILREKNPSQSASQEPQTQQQEGTKSDDSQQQSQQTTQQSQSDKPKEPGKKTFLQWWFG